MVPTHPCRVPIVHTCPLNVPTAHTCPPPCSHGSITSPQGAHGSHMSPSVSPWVAYIPISAPTAHLSIQRPPQCLHNSHIVPISGVHLCPQCPPLLPRNLSWRQEPSSAPGQVVSMSPVYMAKAIQQVCGFFQGLWAPFLEEPMSHHMSWLSQEQMMSVMIHRAEKGHLGLSNPREPCGCTSVMFAHKGTCRSFSWCLDSARGSMSARSLDTSKAQPSRKHTVKTASHTSAFRVDCTN